MARIHRLNILHDCECETSPLHLLDTFQEDLVCRLWSNGPCLRSYPIGLLKHRFTKIICELKDDYVLEWLDCDAQVNLRNFLVNIETEMKERFRYWVKGLFGLFKFHLYVEGDRGIIELSVKFTGIIEGVLLGESISHLGKVSGKALLKNSREKIFRDNRKLLGESYDSYTMKMYDRTNRPLPSCLQLEDL